MKSRPPNPKEDIFVYHSSKPGNGKACPVCGRSLDTFYLKN
jgi:hypothetical protein